MTPSIYDSLSRDAEAAAESLSVMMEKERTIYRRCDCLLQPDDAGAGADAIAVTPSDRRMIVDWCYGVIDQLKFDRETVAMTMDLVDRFLSVPSPVAYRALRDRGQYQLVAMASLYVCIKTNERAALDGEFFSRLSHGAYSAKDIEDTELAILKGLSWRICAPTSVQMANRILSLVLPHVNLRDSAWGIILDEVRFQTEHAVRDYRLTTLRRSTVALAAVFNALDQISSHDRRAILRSLLFVVDLEFDHPDILRAAKNRLQSLVEADDAMVEEEVTVVASDAEETVASSDASWRSGLEGIDYHVKTSKRGLEGGSNERRTSKRLAQ